jgi:hypothetical protein
MYWLVVQEQEVKKLVVLEKEMVVNLLLLNLYRNQD